MPFSGRVVPWSARVKLGVPLALALSCFVLFLLGLAKHDIRVGQYRPVLWGLLAGTAALVGLWVITLVRLGHRITVDGGAVRISGRTPIELGTPRKITKGRFERFEARRKRSTAHYWLAVEGDGGRKLVFLRSGKSDWPERKPPAAADTYDASAIDLAALDAALHDQ